MQILIYGFQRSGTTLLRRLIGLHPEVKRMFHEQLVLRRLEPNPRMLRIYLRNMGVDIKNDNWGEKVPYYNTAKRMSPIKYCEKWMETFRKKGKIIHIIRHPYDSAFSVVKKYNDINGITGPLKIYKNVVPKVLKTLDCGYPVLNIKYEDLLMNPDETVYKIYDFCGLTPNIDYKERMKKIENRKYKEINSDRSFAYKKKEFKVNVDMSDVIELLNKFPGITYEI